MRTGIAAVILLAGSAALSAQTGVSGQPGVPTTTLAPLPDASSSPAIAAPQPAAAPPPAAAPTIPPSRPAAGPAPAAAAVPAAIVAPAPVAPAPPPPAPEEARHEKRRGADFYAPYLSPSIPIDDAIADLTRRSAEKEDDAGLHNDLGNLLALRGFAREAVDHYRKAARLDRTFFLPDYNEGLLWEKEGKNAEAISAYRRSIRKKPGFPLSRFHLGFLYEKEGRNANAVAEYAKALRIDPSLRWPARNPLVVQTRLLYRASLVNYERDLASATIGDDAAFADRAVWERLHPQQPVATVEVEEEEEPARLRPGDVVRPGPASAPIIGGKPTAPDARRQQLINQLRRQRPARPSPTTNPYAPPPPVVGPSPPPAAFPEPSPPEDDNAPNPAMQQPPPEEEPPPPPPPGF